MVQKALNGHCNMQIFKNIPEEHAPGLLLELFLLLKLLKINSAEKKKHAGKSDKNWSPFPEKHSEYAPGMKHFQKSYLRLFSGLNVCVFR